MNPNRKFCVTLRSIFFFARDTGPVSVFTCLRFHRTIDLIHIVTKGIIETAESPQSIEIMSAASLRPQPGQQNAMTSQPEAI
jgi:hypothetical protein